MATTAPTQEIVSKDFLPLKGTDHVEFYVGNARQASYFYRAAFGMSLIAYAGPETGLRDRASYVLQQGKVRFVLTTALRSDSEIAEHVHRHGDGVGSMMPAMPGCKRPYVALLQCRNLLKLATKKAAS